MNPSRDLLFVVSSVFDSNEPHKVMFPVPMDKLPKKAGSEMFGVGSYPDKDVEGWLRRMCILR